MEVTQYQSSDAETWNAFLKQAFNASFLFDRGYMDYHSDRFEDFSLMVYVGDELVAVIPANRVGDRWFSHGGLTYGGIVMKKAMSQRVTLQCLSAMQDFLKAEGFKEITYKALPQVYYDKLYQNLEYGLFKHGYECFRRDASTSIVLKDRAKMPKGRKSAINKAAKLGMTVSETNELSAFFVIQDANIKKKYDATTVHTVDEMRLLKDRFPNNIRLYVAEYEGETVAGGLVYLNKDVMHLQYFAMNEKGEQLSATDLVIDHLIKCCDAEGIGIFDFGISTEEGGKYLNEGLNKYKESFGGVTTLYEFYRLALNE